MVAAQALPAPLSAQAASVSAPASLLVADGSTGAGGGSTAGAGTGSGAGASAGTGAGSGADAGSGAGAGLDVLAVPRGDANARAASGADAVADAGAAMATPEGAAALARLTAGPTAPTLSVQLERLPTVATDGALQVLVPAALQATGFSFSLPLALTMALAPSQLASAALRDETPLPAWLQFDPSARSFRAQAVPAGALPLTVVVSAGGRRALVTLTPP
jgi:hypothetical protein